MINYQEWVKAEQGRYLGSTNSQNWLAPTNVIQCPLDPEQRNYDSDPIFMTVSHTTAIRYWFAWYDIPLTIKFKQLKKCRVNCYFSSLWNNYTAARSDGFISFVETTQPVVQKSCSNQKTLFFTGEPKQPEPGQYDLEVSTFPNADIYHLYGGYKFLNPPERSGSSLDGVLVSAFISNCESKKRLDFVKKLMEYIKVDSFGGCLQNKEIPIRAKQYGQKYIIKAEVIKNYKFHLAFESQIHDGYVTEKYWQALLVGTVPIYMGAPNLNESFIPAPGSVLNVNDFASIEDLAKEIIRLGKNPRAYAKMLEWKKKGVSRDFMARMDLQCATTICEICYKIADSQSKPLFITGSPDLILLVRERNTFWYKTIHLKKRKIKNLHLEILRVFAGQKPIWVDCITNELRRFEKYNPDFPPLRIWKVYPSDWKPKRTFIEPGLNTDESIQQLISGTKLDVVFV